MISSLVDETTDASVVMLVAGLVPQDLPADHQPCQDFVEFAELVGRVGAKPGFGSINTGSVAVPRLHLGIARPDEERVFALGVTGSDHRHCFGLRKAGEIEKVGVLVEVE